MSWIFLEISPGNLLEICSVKLVDTLQLYFAVEHFSVLLHARSGVDLSAVMLEACVLITS